MGLGVYMALFTLQYQLERNLRPFKQDEIQQLPKQHRSSLQVVYL